MFYILLINDFTDHSSHLKYNNIVQLEGTIKLHLVQLPVHFRAKQMLKCNIKDINQMPLELWQT